MSTIDLPFHERYTLGPAVAVVPRAGARFLALSMPLIWLADVTIVTSAFLVSYWLRFSRVDDDATLTLVSFTKIVMVVAIATTVLLAQHGFYDRERLATLAVRGGTIISSLSIALVLGVTFSYFFGDPKYSRLWLAAGWLLASIGLTGWRWFAQGIYARIRDRLLPARRAIIVGANATGEDLVRALGHGYEVVGYVDNGSDLESASAALPLLGPIAELERFVHTHAIDEVFIALPADRREQIANVIQRGFRRRVEVRFLPDVGTLPLPKRVEIRHVGAHSVIGFASSERITIVKRIVDVALGLIVLAVLLPILIGIAIVIRRGSPGPALYRQVRVGKDGQRFHMYKFRSMCNGAEAMIDELRAHNEAVGPLFKIRKDPRVTPVGAFLRRYSLDELPQIINVLRGEMSLVGPRPPLPEEVQNYEEWQLGRLRAVPGMTGLWQVSGRSQVPFQDMVRLDLHYIRNWSLAMDLQILARTIPAVLSNRGAY